VEPSDFCEFGAEKAGRRSAADCAGSAGQGGLCLLDSGDAVAENP
jgi:hypothetical protein